MMKSIITTLATSFVLAANAQLAVSVSGPKLYGEKVVVQLSISNGFPRNVESARAAVFLIDENGKMAGQSTQWVIGGGKDKPVLRSGGTNVFNFVINSTKPVASTNLTTRITFNRVVLEGGKIADPRKDVRIETAPQ